MKFFKNKLEVTRELPIGMKEFEIWSDRIISQSAITQIEDPKKAIRGFKWVLAEMIMHLGPREAFKEDGHFVLGLRKGAVNETAVAVMRKIKDEQAQEIEKSRQEMASSNLEVIDGEFKDSKGPVN